MALFIDGVPGMPKEDGPRKRSRWIRVDGAVRLIDAPNSRMGLEVDLSLLPWDPFDALGKKVTILVPSSQTDDTRDNEPDEIQRALRFVGHAADRCREFAQAGIGDKSDWWKAYQTWDWLRNHLTAEWEPEPMDPSSASEKEEEGGNQPHLPNLPGAASILEYTLGALRTIPLQHWEETVSTLDPEAPSREEAIRTVRILSRLLRKPIPEDQSETGVLEPDPGKDKMAPHQPATAGSPTPPFPADDLPKPDEPTQPAESARPHPHDPMPGEDGEDMSFEHAYGFDEGYRKGRRVGFALGNHSRHRNRRHSEEP